jgi:hypothetical protein
MATQNNVANGQLRSRDGGGERFGAATPSPLAMKQQQSLIDAASVGNTQVGAIDTLQNRIMQGVTANMRGSLEVGTTGASELLPQLASKFGVPAEVPEFTQRLYRHLKDKNMSMSDLLDSIDRSSYYTGEMGQLDAYQRQLAIAGIKTKSIPEKGVFADKVERFFQSNVPGSQVLFPEFINRTMRQAKLAPDILPYILATTTGIQAGEAYRTIYTNDVVDDRRLFRVDQTAEMSRTRLGG